MTNNSQTLGQLLFAKLGLDLGEVPIDQLSNYTAVEYYLTLEEEPPHDATNFEKVRRYLEAFYHLCEVEDWERASKILSISLDTPTNQELHEQLGTWGYYRQQIDLYSQLLGKLNSSRDLTCLNGLGSAYCFLGEYRQAFDYLGKALFIELQIGNRYEEGRTMGNLGNIYHALGEYQQAIVCHQRHLTIAQKINDRYEEGTALGNLGNVYYTLGRYEEAITCHYRYLDIAQEIGDRYSEGTALNNLGMVYSERIIGNRTNNLEQAIHYLQHSLEIATEIGNRRGEAEALKNLAEAYPQLGNHSLALEYCDRALAIATELGIPLAKECQELKEKLCS